MRIIYKLKDNIDNYKSCDDGMSILKNIDEELKKVGYEIEFADLRCSDYVFRIIKKL